MTIITDIFTTIDDLRKIDMEPRCLRVNEKVAEELRNHYANHIVSAHEKSFQGTITRIWDIEVITCLGFNPQDRSWTIEVAKVRR